MEKSIALLIVLTLVCFIVYYLGLEVGEKTHLGKTRNVYTLPEGVIYQVLWYSDDRYQVLLRDPDGNVIFAHSCGAKFPHSSRSITLMHKKMYVIESDKAGTITTVPLS